VTAAPFGSLPRVDSIALVARGQTPRDAALLAQPLVLYGHPEDVGRLAAEAASLRERAAASGDAVLLLTYPAAVESFVAALASRVSLEPVTLATTVEGRLPEVWRLPAARLVATGPGGRELVLEGPNPVLLPGNGPFEVRRLPG
jgi:hypothetical protein